MLERITIVSDRQIFEGAWFRQECLIMPMANTYILPYCTELCRRAHAKNSKTASQNSPWDEEIAAWPNLCNPNPLPSSVVTTILQQPLQWCSPSIPRHFWHWHLSFEGHTWLHHMFMWELYQVRNVKNLRSYKLKLAHIFNALKPSTLLLLLSFLTAHMSLIYRGELRSPQGTLWHTCHRLW